MKEMAYLAALTVVSALALVGCGLSAASSASPRPGDITIKPVTDASGRAEPDRPLHCTATHAHLTKVSVTRSNGSVVSGSLDPSAGTWTPSQPLSLDARYAVVATAADTSGKSVSKRLNIETISPTDTITAHMVEPGDLVRVINPSKPVTLDNGDGDWNLSWSQWSTPNATR